MGNKTKFDSSNILNVYNKTGSIVKTASIVGCSVTTVQRHIGSFRKKEDRKITLQKNKRAKQPYGRITLSPSEVSFLGITEDEPFIDIIMEQDSRTIRIAKKKGKKG